MSGRSESTKPALRPHWVSQRERSATRDALIHVARELVARDGEPALTLGAVADEAGIARATVYGFFAGRRELLDALDPSKPEIHEIPPQTDEAAPQPDDASAAIWTNCQPDLSAFLPEPAALEEPEQPEPQPALAAVDAEMAPAAHDVPAADDTVEAAAEPKPEPVMEPAEAQAEAAPAEEVAPVPAAEEIHDAAPRAYDATTPHVEEAVPEIAAETSHDIQALDAVEPEALADDSDAEEIEALSAQDERRRLQAAHLEEIAKRLILPESALKEGTDAVISRLDTRIRVLEKSITAIETRQTAAETDAPRRLKPVTDAVEQLKARADASDGKQLHTISELRLSIHQLETRIDALEAPHRGAVSGALSWPEPVSEPAETSETVLDETAAPAPGEDAENDNPKQQDYLSAVRTLAKEGARQAAERETQYESERQTRRRNMIVAACIALVCLCAIGLLYQFRPGPHGVSTAQSKTHPVSVAAMAPKHPPLAPLDRLTALAQKGDAKAELLVGLKYLQSNDALAATWLERAAGHGNAVAQNALGALYQNGRGVNADLAKAEHLYETAAARGNRHAMSNLAIFYAGGNDKTKNFVDAARWFQRSASLGYVDAQFNLAVLYERGDGVPQSLLDAYKWYTIASASGDAVAKTRADAIATQISPDELAAAQKAAGEFKPAPQNPAANAIPAMSQVLAAR